MSEIEELVALQAELNCLRAQRREEAVQMLLRYGEIPPSRRLRLRHAVQRRVSGLRSRVARWVDPYA